MEPHFSLAEIIPGRDFSIDDTFNSQLIYVVKGELQAHMGKNLRHLTAHQLMLLPIESRAEFHSVAPVSEIVVLTQSEMPEVCFDVTIDGADRPSCKTEYRNVINAPSVAKLFFQHITDLLQHGVHSEMLGLTFRREVFMLLQASMDADEFTDFLSPMFHARGGFKAKVMRLVDNTMTVSDLAHAIGMNRSYFQRTFKVEFGENPSDWLIKRRARDVIEYFRTHHEPLKVAYVDLKFSTMSNLSAFCKRYIGMTAREIRRAKSIDCLKL